MDEFVLDFVEEGSITPIDIVSDITGLTYEELRSCSDILLIDIETDETKVIESHKTFD